MKASPRTVLRSVRRRGLRVVVVQGLDELRQRVAPNSTHVWYLLDLRQDRPLLPIPGGYAIEELSPASAKLELLDVLGPNARAEAETRFAGGGRLFTALTESDLAFACWIFRAIPTRAARNGWLELPGELRGLEYSVTVEQHRGRGLAPAVWLEVAGLLEADGVDGLVTKVGLANDASRRAVKKAGFDEIGYVTVTRRAGKLRVDVREPRHDIGAHLANELRR